MACHIIWILIVWNITYISLSSFLNPVGSLKLYSQCEIYYSMVMP
jgi:hypothetical protein